MSERDKVKKKVAALLEKTEDRGASEYEAMAAAQKVAELMEHYDIEIDELEIRKASCVQRSIKYQLHGRTRIGRNFLVAISRLCDVKVWTNVKHNEAVFFGLSQDVEVAEYLFSILVNAVVSELEHYKQSDDYFYENQAGTHARTLQASFLNGMEERISERIFKMADKKYENVEKARGTDLVIIKDEIINEDFSDLGIKLRNMPQSRLARNSKAFRSGESAGSRVNIGAGLSDKKNGTTGRIE